MAGPRDIDQLQREIQELFSDLWQVPRFAGTRRGFRPQADCYRTDDPPEIHVIVFRSSNPAGFVFNINSKELRG